MTPTDHDRIQLAIVPTDAVARAAELRWGVVSPARKSGECHYAHTLERRLATCYATAIAHGDAPTVERLAPKIAQAIRAMEAEAEAAGHTPLALIFWEAPLADGRVLVVCRTTAEAGAIQGASDGRERVVWTMEELANVLPTLEITYQVKTTFPGARVRSTVQRSEGYAHDWAVDSDFAFLHDSKHPNQNTA